MADEIPVSEARMPRLTVRRYREGFIKVEIAPGCEDDARTFPSASLLKSRRVEETPDKTQGCR
jgi:hypothetical protein